MPRRLVYIATTLLVILGLESCTRGAKILSKGEMEDVYIDMIVADQWLRDNSEFRTRADTTRFFDAVFQRHHCTLEDFDASVFYYTSDPETFSNIISEVQLRITEQQEVLNELYQRSNAIRNANKAKELKYTPLDFSPDSVGWRLDSLPECRRVELKPSAPDSTQRTAPALSKVLQRGGAMFAEPKVASSDTALAKVPKPAEISRMKLGGSAGKALPKATKELDATEVQNASEEADEPDEEHQILDTTRIRRHLQKVAPRLRTKENTN